MSRQGAHVERIEMRSVLRHAETVIDLPAKGIVAVSGPNGAGKSTLLEAVSATLWGKYLRDEAPWAADDAYAAVRLRGGLSVRHERLAGKSRVTVEGWDARETATKAKQDLAGVLGPWELWRRSRVFSSADGATFADATDAERKRMLEGVLDVARFDRALDACRGDLRRATGVLHQALGADELARARLGDAREALARARALVAEAEQPLADSLPREAALARIFEREAAAKTANERLKAAREAQTVHAGETAEIKAALRALDLVLARAAAGTCGACGQAVPAAVAEPEAAKARLDKKRFSQQLAVLPKAADAMAAQILADSALREELLAEVAVLRAGLREQDSHAAAAARMRARADEAAAELEAAEDTALDAGCAAADARAETALLEAVEKVLGVRGARASMLGRALAGLEKLTNGWLARLPFADPGKRLEARMTQLADRGDGRPEDTIPFEMRLTEDGATRTLPFKALSGGERRRAKLASMLALAAVADAAGGADGGTVFADEVFDALDDAGKTAAVQVLTELAIDRAVVVISHDAALLGSLPAVLRLQVVAGQVTEVRG